MLQHYNSVELWVRCAKAPYLYIIFDFDGTLAPIVKEPSNAFISTSTIPLLKQLAHLVPIGILSGRSLTDLASRLPFTPNFLSGTHGLESAFLNIDILQQYQNALLILKKVLEDCYPQLHFENKTIGFTIHLREIPQSHRLEREILTFLAYFPEVKTILGKKVINILPNRPYDKGWVIKKLLKTHPQFTFLYIGDDVTDEKVFEIKHKALINLRIGKRRESEATYYLKNQKEIDAFIEKLILTRKMQ